MCKKEYNPNDPSTYGYGNSFRDQMKALLKVGGFVAVTVLPLGVSCGKYMEKKGFMRETEVVFTADKAETALSQARLTCSSDRGKMLEELHFNATGNEAVVVCRKLTTNERS